MAHQHEQDDTYFIDQLCMVALSGAFGAVCLSLYFTQPNPATLTTRPRMLDLLLGPQFHPFVLISGIALVVIAMIRGAVLWSEAGKRAAMIEPTPAPAPALEDHQHGETCGHDHGHEEPCHSHAHSHAHSHSHGGDDHDHSWAPWRYVVLLIPIVLFLLGLPSRGPTVQQPIETIDLSRDIAEVAEQAAALTGLGVDGWSQVGLVAKMSGDQAVSSDVQPVNFKLLEEMAASEESRQYWKGRTIKLKGQYTARSPNLFHLVRFRIQCCAADATQLNVPMLSKDPITGIKQEQWVEVIGRVDFRNTNGAWKTFVIVPSSHAVKETTADLNPYEQL